MHKKRFLDVVQFITSGESAGDPSSTEKDTTVLEDDAVCEAVIDYGLLGSKIETLAQLRQIPGARAEFAMLGLGRAYVRRCVLRNGEWTSGVHVLWWTRKRLCVIPAVHITDFRLQTAAGIDRQFDLAVWSMIMLRLHFISDVAASAPSEEEVSQLADLVERAAEATETPDPAALMLWIRSEGEARLSKFFPRTRYDSLRKALHKDDAAEGPDSH